MKIRGRIEEELAQSGNTAAKRTRVEREESNSREAASSAASKESRVEISTLARELQNIKLDDPAESEERRAKVRRLSEQYKTGTLKPANSEEVAAAFIQALEEITG